MISRHFYDSFELSAVSTLSRNRESVLFILSTNTCTLITTGTLVSKEIVLSYITLTWAAAVPRPGSPSCNFFYMQFSSGWVIVTSSQISRRNLSESMKEILRKSLSLFFSFLKSAWPSPALQHEEQVSTQLWMQYQFSSCVNFLLCSALNVSRNLLSGWGR